MNAPWNPGRTGQRDTFAAFVCDDPTIEVLRSLALEFGWNDPKLNKGGLRNAIQTLSVSASPHILLVDLSESPDPLNDINGLAEVCEPGTIVIAIGAVNDVRLYRDLLASGIQDYILKPFHPHQLRDMLLEAQAVLAGPARGDDGGNDRPHLAAAVIGVRGGVGATTVATSVAWLLGSKLNKVTALLDLDLQFGTGALAFDLEPGRGLSDALENPSRIDGLFIERALVKAADNLAVLSTEAPITQPLIADGNALYQLQEELRNAFDCMVVDMPRAMMAANPHLLHELQTVLVVSELTLSGARDTIRVLSYLKSNAPSSRIMVVANRVQSGIASEISRKDFEDTIERKVDYEVAFDIKTSAIAARQGKCFADAGKTTKAAATLGVIAAHLFDALIDPAAAGKRRSLLDALKGKAKESTAKVKVKGSDKATKKA